MKPDPVNLTVTDVRAASEFLEAYLRLRRVGGNAGTAFLSDDHGSVLTLMQASKTTEVAYPGNFHIGFVVESEAQVNELNRRLKDDGYEVTPPELHHGCTFYVNAPGGFTIELGSPVPG